MPYHTLKNGYEIFYRTKGKGPVALFLHGVTLDGELWLDQLEGLSDIRTCIAPDLRGHGRSDPNPRREQPTSVQAAEMLEVFDAVAPSGPVDLVGMSAGGTIAALIYEQRPQRIRSLTLISSGFSRSTETRHDPTHDEIARLVINEGKGGYYRRLCDYLMAPTTPLFVRARYRSMIERTSFEAIVSFMADTLPEPRPDLVDKLTLPILRPMGEFDPLSKHADVLPNGPNVKQVAIPAAARLPPIEQPKAVNDSIRAFWAGLG